MVCKLNIALFRSVRQHWLAETTLTFSRRRVTGAHCQSWINQWELSKKLFPDKQKHCPTENLSLLKDWRCIVLMNSPQAAEIIWGNRFGFMNILNLFDLKKKKMWKVWFVSRLFSFFHYPYHTHALCRSGFLSVHGYSLRKTRSFQDRILF